MLLWAAMELTGKTVLITGAARGLGAAMARGLAERGANLALVDLDEASLEDTRTECTRMGATARSYAANVAIENDVVNLFDRVVGDFGGLDASIANAGILRDGLLVKAKDGEIIGKMSLAQWQAVIDVNLTGVFLCGREAAERMIRAGNGGCIINISSISREGNFGQSNYSAAKAGVAALTVVWAKELARHRIRVNAIAPGFIKTEMVASMKPEMLEKAAAAIPLQRLGEPHEIAHTAVYLLENEYVTGRVIDIDGGQRI
jgi:3-oxoacyl-[acyl-carrier protein] reductase